MEDSTSRNGVRIWNSAVLILFTATCYLSTGNLSPWSWCICFTAASCLTYYLYFNVLRLMSCRVNCPPVCSTFKRKFYWTSTRFSNKYKIFLSCTPNVQEAFFSNRPSAFQLSLFFHFWLPFGPRTAWPRFFAKNTREFVIWLALQFACWKFINEYLLARSYHAFFP